MQNLKSIGLELVEILAFLIASTLVHFGFQYFYLKPTFGGLRSPINAKTKIVNIDTSDSD